MLFIKKYGITCLVLAVVLYILVGAMAPFAGYKKISKETAASVDVNQFFQNPAGGERASILETGESAWEERLRLLNGAKERIVLSTFDMREGQSTEDILSVILHKADAGVRVQILVDGISGFLRMEGKPLFYAVSTHPNVEIRLYNPVNILLPWRLQGRMHDKYIMVDYQAYMIGGRNTFDYFIGNYEQENNSLDREVLIYNTKPEQPGSMAKLETYFESVWNSKYCRDFHGDESLAEHPKVVAQRELLRERYMYLTSEFPELFSDYDYEAATVPIDGVELVTNPTGIYGKEPIVFYTLTELMKSSKKIDLHTPYIVCNDYMYERLSETASAAEEAKMVINSVENGDNIVASSDYLRNKPDVLATGFTLYEYDGGTSTHGKSITMNGDISVIGSYNFDLRSTYMDTEMMLVVKSKELTEELQGNMDILEKDCRKVIDETTYEVPEHVTVRAVSSGKIVLMKLIGFVLSPFRYVI